MLFFARTTLVRAWAARLTSLDMPGKEAATRVACRSSPPSGLAVNAVPKPARAERRDDLEDTALVELVGKSDHEALAVLYKRYGSICYRLARRITANDALAEDAVQETFAGLWRDPGAFAPGVGTVRGWLLWLTHHK